MILNIENKQVIIDDEDFVLIKPHDWFIQSNGYVVCRPHASNGNIAMHRILLGLTLPSQEADHINRDLLDNRRQNLRLATRQQNGFNRAKRNTKTSSKFIGVYVNRDGKFAANIKFNYACIYLGAYMSDDDAGYAYNVAAKHLAKEFAPVNQVVASPNAKIIEQKVERILQIKVWSKSIKPTGPHGLQS